MMATQDKPSFGIYRADGSKNPSIRKAFVKPQRVDWGDMMKGSLTLEDGTTWELVLEERVAAALNKNDSAYCIVSYQVHNIDGFRSNYAVVRLYTPKRLTND